MVIDVPPNSLSPLTKEGTSFLPIDSQTQLWRNFSGISVAWSYTSWIEFISIPYIIIQYTTGPGSHTILKFKVPENEQLNLTYYWFRISQYAADKTFTLNEILTNKDNYSLYYGSVTLKSPMVSIKIKPYDGKLEIVDNQIHISFNSLYVAHELIVGDIYYQVDAPLSEY